MGQTLNGTAGFVYMPGIGNRNSYNITDSRILVSANDPMVYQMGVQHNNNGLDYVPSAAGDVVNVVFQVYARPAGCNLTAWTPSTLIAEIRKPSDIPFTVYSNDLNSWIVGQPYNMDGNLTMKTFTVDISDIIASRLNYGLIPRGRGSFNSPNQQGNIGNGLTGSYGKHIQSPVGDGAQQVYMKCYFEVLDANGLVVTATISSGSTWALQKTEWNCMFPSATGSAQHGYSITAINAAMQWGEAPQLNSWIMRAQTSNNNHRFLSNAPNGDTSSTWTTARYLKPIRIEDNAENLYFYLYSLASSTTLSTYAFPQTYQTRIFDIYMKVEMYNSDTTTEVKYLNVDTDTFWYSAGNWNDSAASGFGPGGYEGFLSCYQWPRFWLAQNISPEYINGNAGLGGGVIDANTQWYRVSLEWMDNESGSCDCACPATTGDDCEDNYAGDWTGDTYRISEYRYYTVDHSANPEPFPYIRFHWLNGKGGIDSYTCRKSQTESLSRKISTYEREGNNPNYGLQQYPDAAPGTNAPNIDSTWGTYQLNYGLQIGMDQYKTDLEILEVQSRESGSVYTDPMNKVEATWFKEIFMSPNVWIEVENGRSDRLEAINDYTYPSDKGYSPVIIKEGDQLTLDSEKRLVQFKVEYMAGHAQKTQRN